jgi:hypothetical protein
MLECNGVAALSIRRCNVTAMPGGGSHVPGLGPQFKRVYISMKTCKHELADGLLGFSGGNLDGIPVLAGPAHLRRTGLDCAGLFLLAVRGVVAAVGLESTFPNDG